MDGRWRSRDLAGLLRMMLRDQEVLEGLGGPFSFLGAISRWIGHALRRNTRSGARRNISAHLRRGKRLLPVVSRSHHALFLRLFFVRRRKPGRSVDRQAGPVVRHAGAQARLARPGIGSGWGACAVHMARKYGCNVVSIHDFRAPVRRGGAAGRGAGLEDRVEIRMQDLP